MNLVSCLPEPVTMKELKAANIKKGKAMEDFIYFTCYMHQLAWIKVFA